MISFITLSCIRIIFYFALICSVFYIIINSESENNRNINVFLPNISRKPTFESDAPNRNEDFVRQKTVNIIIENKKEYIIKTNIQELRQETQNNEINNDILTMRENNNSIKSTTSLND